MSNPFYARSEFGDWKSLQQLPEAAHWWLVETSRRLVFTPAQAGSGFLWQ